MHELHIWRLDQKKAIASAHIVVSNNEMTDFMDRARTISECLHAYGIHSATLQPELASATTTAAATPTPSGGDNVAAATPANSIDGGNVSGNGGGGPSNASIRRRRVDASTACQIACSSVCENLTCCNTPLRL